MRRLILFICLLFILNSKFYSQDCSELESDLLSGNFNLILPAVEMLKGTRCPNSYEAILTIIREQSPRVQFALLEVLHFQEYPDVIGELYSFIERSDNFGNDEYPLDPLTAKVYATSILFVLGDYSTYQYVLDLVDRGINENNVGALEFTLMYDISIQFPELDGIKTRVENILNTTQDKRLFYYSLDYLAEKYFNDYSEIIVDIFRLNNDYPSRCLALKFLSANNYSNFHSILLDQLQVETEWTMRVNISDTLLSVYGSPLTMYTLINYYPGEPNETARTIMQYSVLGFIPPRPTIPTTEMMDSLDSYVDQLLEFTWISDSNTYLEFKEKTDRLRENYEAPNIKEVCWRLTAIIDLATQYHGSSAFTEEAYKFLYYYTGYIKENVETEFGICE